MMLSSLIRFASFGWIKLYIDPQFHFTYYGFQWVKPLEIIPIYFFIIAAIALFVALGFKYKRYLPSS
jgi:hypothetical protein